MKSQLTKSQFFTKTKTFQNEGQEYTLKIKIRYDDECENGHNTFAITGEVKNKNGVTIMAGCCQEIIAKIFPEYSHLIKWHLCNSDMPMYYYENTLYNAGNSASSKYKAGEPNRWGYVLKFRNSNITHKLEPEFIEYLKEYKKNNSTEPFEVLEVKHDNKPDDTYKYSSRYTVKGSECKWYQCPFDNKIQAEQYVKELNTKSWTIKRIVTGYQEEKERNFNAARHCAIWEDATDEQLSLPSKELKKLLKKRLPKLMKEFKKDIESLGFIY